MRISFEKLEEKRAKKEEEEKELTHRALSSGLEGICLKCFAPLDRLGAKCPYCDKEKSS